MRSSSPAGNLLERRRRQYDEGLGDLLLVDRVPVDPLPHVPSEPRGAPAGPLPLIGRVLGFFGRQRTPAHARAIAINTEAAKNLPSGSPPVDVTVMPVWDSRLVDMRDFLATPAAEAAAPGTTTLTYTVPLGYVAILRQFRYVTDPPALGTPTDVRATLLVDELPVLDFVNLPFGPTMADYQSTYVMARAGQVIGLRLVAAVALPAGTDFAAFLYGNLRLDDGRPLNQQAGEKVKPQKIVLPPPAAAPAPQQCGPGEELRRVQLPDGSFAMRCMRMLRGAGAKP